jgi:zinc/manganese transport system ATP-binding protein
MGGRVVDAHMISPAPQASERGIRLDDVTVSFDREPAVHHVNGTFSSGSMTAIVGPNGAGKSTLLKAMVGIVQPDQGHVVLEGLSRAELGYLPQLAEVDRTFPITVSDAVGLGLWHRVGPFGAMTGSDGDIVKAALRTVGLEAMERRSIGALSVGQFQRLLFARLIVQDPQVLLLDEPFAALDELTTYDLLGLVLDWHRQGRTVIAVLHELDQVEAHFPSCLLMAREPIAWGPTAAVLTPANLRKARGLAHDWHGEVKAARPAMATELS